MRPRRKSKFAMPTSSAANWRYSAAQRLKLRGCSGSRRQAVQKLATHTIAPTLNLRRLAQVPDTASATEHRELQPSCSTATKRRGSRRISRSYCGDSPEMTKEIGVMKSIATGTLSAAAMIFAALMVVSPTAAQQSPAQTWCYGNDSTDDQTIAGCAQVIQSGRENHRDLASAYFNRGLAYGHKGDFDHAVADYTQGIQLNPRESRAYTNRGLAYSNKGDFDRAIAD